MTIPLPVRRSNRFDARVAGVTGGPLVGLSVRTVQVNIGLRCNLACHHCHVESSPTRSEEMNWETMRLVLDAAVRAGAQTLDITGGAPEMHPHFRRFVSDARRLGLHVIARTNLTILLDDGYHDFPRFFREQRVHLVASLPCYLEENVDKQRGLGTYRDSIEALRRLNAIGYGIEKDLPLDLMYNPLGDSLPPPQEKLEADYRRELATRFGIHFTKLYTITNMPIGRFQRDLERQGKGEEYRAKLDDTFNLRTLQGLMCRHQVHVGHDGTLYDCDFNYALGMPVEGAAGRHVREFDPDNFVRRRIVTADHCFGCTAGCGSSCGGALV